MIILLEIGILGFHLLSWCAVAHALLTKRDPRSALGWAAVALLVPVFGVITYVIFGISRTQSRATAIMRKNAALEPNYAHPELPILAPEKIPVTIARMEHLGRYLTLQHLCGGNQITPLINGNMAYPAMLEAIAKAQKHIFLVTYIFSNGKISREFVNHLIAAAGRNVDVRVIVDGVGRFYSLKFPKKKLEEAGVKLAFFLPPKLFPPNLSINLRNHRKVLVCDDVAFTGGMNIADYHVVEPEKKNSVQDIQFRCLGPIVYQFKRAFLLDWGFVTKQYDSILPDTDVNSRAGKSLCRIVLDGPGSDSDPLNDLIAGCISSALQSVRIMTPYFLPSREIMAALRAAAEKGVDVRVILPEKNNLFYVHWATFRLLPPLLEAGVRIFYQPPPFAHTKLLAIDGYYSQIGSANYDARSLRLNFELNTEVFDEDFHHKLSEFMDTCIAKSKEINVEDLKKLPILTRLRNATCWIFSPYL